MSSRDPKNKKSAGQNVSFVLAFITLMLVFGYFVQSAIEIYEREVISVAFERISKD